MHEKLQEFMSVENEYFNLRDEIENEIKRIYKILRESYFNILKGKECYQEIYYEDYFLDFNSDMVYIMGEPIPFDWLFKSEKWLLNKTRFTKDKKRDNWIKRDK